MTRITQAAHHFIAEGLSDTAFAIDATAGNGHDTVFLARHAGTVWAMDCQETALEKTRARLAAHGLHARLIHLDHRGLGAFLEKKNPPPIDAVMFNLGYLPGGDKTIITEAESTLSAISALLTRLSPSGRMTILSYRGHPGGKEEASAIARFLADLDPKKYTIESFESTPTGPTLHTVLKKSSKDVP